MTDRGKPKVLITPLSTGTRIEKGIREGWITPGNGEPLRRLRRRFKADRPLQEILDEDRGE